MLPLLITVIICSKEYIKISINKKKKKGKAIARTGEALYEKEIEKKVRKLPETLKKEVLDYIEFLLEKHRGKNQEKIHV